MPVVNDIIGRITSEILQPAAGVVFAAGFLLFMWGLVQFMWSINQGGEHNDGRQHMLWGIIGMVIMISIWAIIDLLLATFGLGNSRSIGNGAATDPNRNQVQTVHFTN